MTLKPCPECGHQISTKATTCPNCGYEIVPSFRARQRSSLKGCGFVVLVFIVFVIIVVILSAAGVIH